MRVKNMLYRVYEFVHDKWNEAYFRMNRERYPIREFKNKYEGEACFVVGNGPSLRKEDLDAISDKGFVSFASNRIYSIFSDTVWRPTYMTVSDPKFIFDKAIAENIQNVNAKMFFTRSQYAWDVRKYKCKTCPVAAEASRRLLDNPRFSLNCDETIYDIATVTYFSIQLAAYMGFKTIYLIGMDNRYPYTINRDGTIVENPGVVSYFGGEKNEIQKKHAAPLWESEIAFNHAEMFSRRNGFRIYNATRGGCLENFDRINFEDAMKTAESLL